MTGEGFITSIFAWGMINPWQVLHMEKGEQGASGLWGELADWVISSLQQSLSKQGMADSVRI
jgi:hypothetical protein